MLLLQLIKKDLLLIKKLVIALMIALVILPIFIAFTAPTLAGLPALLYISVIAELMMFRAISQTEAKSPKAAALLCAAPYSRNTIVKAKYVLFLLIFAYCYITYSLVMLVLHVKNLPDLSNVLIVLLINVMIQAIYLPIEFRYGLVKANFIFLGVILAFSLGPMLLSQLFKNITIDLSGIQALPSVIKITALALANVVILGASMFLSLSIYNKKDL